MGVLVAYLVFSPLLEVIGLPISFRAVSLMDWQRIFELLAAALVILTLAPYAIASDRRWAIRISWWQLAGWTGFFTLGFFSAARSYAPAVAWLEWSWTLSWFVMTALLLLLPFSDKEAFTELACTWVVVVLASYSSLFYILNSDALFDVNPILAMTFPGFSNVRVLSDYQTGILFLIPVAIRNRVAPGPWRWLAWLLGGLYVAIVFATGSRSVLLGQFVACGGIWVLLGSRCRRFLALHARLVLLGFVIYSLLFVLLPILTGDEVVGARFLRSNASGRIELWSLAWSMAAAFPWLGAGPMHFAVYVNPIAASPHNQIMQLLAEWGIPATIVFIVLVGHWLIWRLRLLAKRHVSGIDSDHHFDIAVIAALIALFAQSMVSPVFNNPTSQILLTLFSALAVKSVTSAGKPDGPFGYRAVSVAALVSLVGIAWSVAPWLARISERNDCYSLSLIDRPDRIYMPRFWQQGWILPYCESP